MVIFYSPSLLLKRKKLKLVSYEMYLGITLEELSKDKPVDKNVEKNAGNFVQCLEDIDSELSKQIAYLVQVYFCCIFLKWFFVHDIATLSKLQFCKKHSFN